MGSIAGEKAVAFSGAIGIALAILMPLLYGVMGFITGAIGALLYNLFAGWIGGFELKIDEWPALPGPVPMGALHPNPLA